MIKLYCLQDFAPKLYCLQVLRSSRVNVGFTSLLITQEFRCFKISKICYIYLTGARLWPGYPRAPALANKLLVWDSNSRAHCLQLLVSLCFLLFSFIFLYLSFIFLCFPFIFLCSLSYSFISLSYFFVSFGLLPLSILALT